MIELKLADPTPHELGEYRLLISELKDKFPEAHLMVDRGDGDYAISGTSIWIDDDKHTAIHFAIYPSVPNRGTALALYHDLHIAELFVVRIFEQFHQLAQGNAAV